MSDALRDRIAAVVSLHDVSPVTEQDEMYRMLRSSRWTCDCGDEGPIPATGREEDAVLQINAEHVADVILALPGIAVVELPEPEPPSGATSHGYNREKPGVFSWSEGCVTAIDDWVELDGHSMTPADARQLAAELLAAASHADNHVR